MNVQSPAKYKPMTPMNTLFSPSHRLKYTVSQNTSTPINHGNMRSPISVPSSHQQYQRMKYYSALRTGLKHLGEAPNYLDTPMHVIEPSWFVLLPQVQQSSLITIFSICNCMIGSSLTSLPWAYSQSGLVLGVLISFVLFFICFYT
jgi:hypothetical protein